MKRYILLLIIISLTLLLAFPLHNYFTIGCGILTEQYKCCDMVNIGDYIQSLAAMQFCKRKELVYLDRDSINSYKGKRIKLIMNAWWKTYKNNILPSEYISPLYISYHLSNPKSISKDYFAYLKEHEPIGCRDTYTSNLFTKLGIKSYFSGCLTLTLGKTYRNIHKHNSKIIYFVDCPLCSIHKQLIMDLITNITKYSDYKIIEMTHEYSKNISQRKRFELADSILKKYESAFLVLTSRLHACLPCIAMDTSVILIRNNLDNRFSGLINFTNYIIFHKNETHTKILHDNGYIINPNIYKNISEKLYNSVKDFLFTKKL